MKPIEQKHLDRLKAPTISSQLPIVFSNGYEISDIHGDCSCCGNPIKDDLFRGTVKEVIDDCYVVDAVGACYSCGIMVLYYWRLKADKSIEGLNTAGKWVRCTPKLTLLEKIITFLNKLLA